MTTVQCLLCRVIVPVSNLGMFDRCKDKNCPLQNQLHPSAPAVIDEQTPSALPERSSSPNTAPSGRELTE